MAEIKKIYHTPVLIILLLFSFGCESSTDPIDERKELLSSAPWSIDILTVSGVDISSAFVGSTIDFNIDGNFTTDINTDFADIWPTSGSWSLESLDQLNFNGIPMTISKVDPATLILQFSYVTASVNPDGRITSIEGDYVVSCRR